jgi:hypothetical protein
MASVTIAVSSQFYSNNWYKNLKTEVLKRSSNIFSNLLKPTGYVMHQQV